MNKEKTELDVRKFEEQFSSESSIRILTGTEGLIISIIAISMTVFQFYTGGFGAFVGLMQRSIHLAFTTLLIFLLYPSTTKNFEKDRIKIPWYDYFLGVLSAIVCLYLAVNYNAMAIRSSHFTVMDLIIGGIGTLMVLETTRRTSGPALPIIAICFLLYAYFGRIMPGFLIHRGFSIERIITQVFLGTEGIFGIPLGVSSTFVFLFIMFAAILSKTGMGQFFIDLSTAIAGRTIGGPAKVAVLSSALFGSISGSAVANVVATGTFTIPLMKSVGYEKEFAGAVEAAASTGGQIMPPVMGAAAFIMAEFLGIPYITIAAAAVIPAIIYFLSVGLMVHFEAKRLKLKTIPKDQLPNIIEVLKSKFHLTLPIFGLVFLLIRGYSVSLAAFWTIVFCILVSMAKAETRMSLKAIVDAFEDSAKMALSVASACACSGIIVGVVSVTGLGLKMGNGLVIMGRGNLFLTLFFTMIASLVLGMGLPTTAKYIVLSIMVAPALIKLGVHPLASHLFLLYFGIIADITPPVALAAFAGAGIAGGKPMKTAIIAVKLSLAGFIVPYIFAYDEGLLGMNSTLFHSFQLLLSCLMGTIALASALSGFLLDHINKYERILLFLASFALLKTDFLTDMIGFFLLLIVIILQKIRMKK